MRTAYGKLIPYGVEPTAEAEEKWFVGGAQDKSPAPADRAGYETRFCEVGLWTA